MSDRFSAELLREMENSIHNENDEEESASTSNMIMVKYRIIPGLRDGSEIMWAFEENQLYYKNTYHASKKRETVGYLYSHLLIISFYLIYIEFFLSMYNFFSLCTVIVVA